MNNEAPVVKIPLFVNTNAMVGTIPNPPKESASFSHSDDDYKDTAFFNKLGRR